MVAGSVLTLDLARAKRLRNDSLRNAAVAAFLLPTPCATPEMPSSRQFSFLATLEA